MISPRTRKRDGRRVYDVRLRAPDGKEYSTTFETKKAAETFETTERAAKFRGGWVDPRRAAARVADVAGAWLASDPAKRHSSAARDRSILAQHVLPSLGDKPVGSVTPADVQKLVNAWATSHAPSTVGRHYSCLRAVFSYAEAAEIIVRSPCRSIRMPRVDLVDRPAVSPAVLEQLAGTLGVDAAPMMWLGAVLGLRWAECAGLRVGRVDFLRSTLAVVEQLGRDGRTGPPKSNAGRRSLAVPEWLTDQLAALLARRGLTAADADALLFVSVEGSPLHYSNWRRRLWVPATEAAGLGGLRFHDLRSLAATALVALGVNMKTAQTRLGHSNPQTTLKLYARATVEADRSASDMVGEKFRPRDGRGMDARPARGSHPQPGA